MSGLAPGSPADDPALSTPGFRRLTRDSLVYGLGTISGKAMGLVLLPVLARVLSRDDYGLLDVLWSLGSGVAGILLLGLDAAAVRLYFDEPLRDRARLLATWGVMLSAAAVAGATAIVLAAPWIAQWVYRQSGDRSAVLVLALIIPASLTNYFAATVLRTTGRPREYAAVSVTTFVVYGVTVVVLAISGQASVVTVMGAWGVSLVVTSVLGLLLVRSSLLGFRREAALRLLKYGLPLAPVLAVTLASDFVHRAVLLSAGGGIEVAHLTVALRFASLEALAIAAFQLAWQPRVFGMGTTELALRRIAIDARRFLWLAAAAALAIALIVPVIVPVIAGEPYRAAVPTVGWCLAATLLAAAYAMAATPSAIAKSPSEITRSTVAGICIAVLANVLLAPRLGSVGTAASLVIGQAAAILIIIVSSRRKFSLPGPWLVSSLVVVTTSIAMVLWTAPTLPLWISLAGLTVVGVALILDPALREIVKVARDR